MQVGQVGGFGAAYVMMQSLGLRLFQRQQQVRSVLAEGSAEGKCCNSGAGIAGWWRPGNCRRRLQLHDLGGRGRAGPQLDDSERYAGRNDRRHNANRTFEDGHYFNAGPARLPSQHVTMLGYCRESVYSLKGVNSSRSSLLQNDKFNDGKAVQQRQVI